MVGTSLLPPFPPPHATTGHKERYHRVIILFALPLCIKSTPPKHPLTEGLSSGCGFGREEAIFARWGSNTPAPPAPPAPTSPSHPPGGARAEREPTAQPSPGTAGYHPAEIHPPSPPSPPTTTPPGALPPPRGRGGPPPLPLPLHPIAARSPPGAGRALPVSPGQAG